MSEKKTLRYAFSVDSLDKDVFKVVNFSGQEALSALFRFEVTLVSSAPPSEYPELVGGGGTLSLRTHAGVRNIRGIVSSMELLFVSGHYAIYKAVLVPNVFVLTLNRQNRIFLNQNVVQCASQILQDSGLADNVDFAFKLMESYGEREFVCMYNESGFDFVSRWLELFGLYYYFEDDAGHSCMKIVDNNISHMPLAENAVLPYLSPSGMIPSDTPAVFDLRSTTKRVPKRVVLKDYNYRTPTLKLEKNAPVSDQGDSTFYFYGDHFLNSNEGAFLAKVRAGEYLSSREVFKGKSNVRLMRPGYTFSLQHHPDDSMNREYLLTKVSHQGHQEALLEQLFGIRLIRQAVRAHYANSYEAIPADVQYRPPRVTPKPRIGGYVNARIDAAGSGEYAEVDDQGRYKVVLPFDLSGRGQGKASCWLRMAQPHVGKNFGMHFPLHKGTEVLLCFANGDPDRPVIAAAVPNPDTPSVVSGENHSKCMLRTSGGNLLHMENDPAAKRILMQTPTANSWLRIGAPNDPASDFDIYGSFDSADGITLCTSELCSITCKASNTILLGASTTVVVGLNIAVRLGLDVSVVAGATVDQLLGFEVKTVNALSLSFKKDIKKISGQALSIEFFSNKVAEFDQRVANNLERFDAASNALYNKYEGINNAVDSLSGLTTRLYNRYNTLADQTHTATLNRSQVQQGVNDITLSEQTIKGAVSKLSVAKSEMSGATSSLRGAVTETGTTADIVAGANSSVSGAHNTVTSLHKQI